MDRNGRGLIAQTRQIRQTCNHIQILSAPPEEGEESDPTLNDERNDGYGKPVNIIIHCELSLGLSGRAKEQPRKQTREP